MEVNSHLLKVLAVHHNKAIQMIIKKHLSTDFEVAIVSNQTEALNWMKQEHFPDVIIMGLKIDGDENAGLKFLKTVRASDFYGKIPVFLLSGTYEDFNSEARVKFLKAGADDFLLTPFHPDELKWRIIAILRLAGKLPYTV